jgi:DNA-binding NtrC family response regulator
MHRLQQRYPRNTDAVPDPRAVLDEHEGQERILREWAQAAPKPEAPPRVRSDSPATGAFLLIEDDSDLGELVLMSLQSRGFAGALLARTPAEALSIFEANPDVTAIISDFNLQADRTGLDVVREMQRSRPGVRALIVSGQADEVLSLMTENERQEIEVLRKPPDEEYLEERLRRLLKP